MAESKKVCTYVGCEKPVAATRYHEIIQGKRSAGGQDWTTLVGSVLCDACYQRYKKRGKLERSLAARVPKIKKEGIAVTVADMVSEAPMNGIPGGVVVESKAVEQAVLVNKCGVPGCDTKPGHGKYISIDADSTTGGQDWNLLGGKIICYACYHRYKSTGSLERLEPLPAHVVRKCSSSTCEKPDDQDATFIQIKASSTSGGQDWTLLDGQFLCHPCYDRYRERGTLEAKKKRNVSDKKCFYDLCDRSNATTGTFYLIEEGRKAGNQDWTQLVGKVLCAACYAHYVRTGTLVRSRAFPKKPPSNVVRACQYENCDRPTVSSQFTYVDAGSSAGNQDWSPIADKVLCKACYDRYKRGGTLDRKRQPRKFRPGSRPTGGKGGAARVRAESASKNRGGVELEAEMAGNPQEINHGGKDEDKDGASGSKGGVPRSKDGEGPGIKDGEAVVGGVKHEEVSGGIKNPEGPGNDVGIKREHEDEGAAAAGGASKKAKEGVGAEGGGGVDQEAIEERASAFVRVVPSPMSY